MRENEDLRLRNDFRQVHLPAAVHRLRRKVKVYGNAKKVITGIIPYKLLCSEAVNYT